MIDPFCFGLFARPENVYQVAAGVDDQQFADCIRTREALELNREKATAIVCKDGTNLSAAAFDAFAEPLMDWFCLRLEEIKIAGFAALTPSTLSRLPGRVDQLYQLEVPGGITLDGNHVAELARLPQLTMLTVDSLAPQDHPSWQRGHADLSCLKSLSSLAISKDFLRGEKIQELIAVCGLEELVVRSQFTEDGQRAIEEASEDCKIWWA